MRSSERSFSGLRTWWSRRRFRSEYPLSIERRSVWEERTRWRRSSASTSSASWSDPPISRKRRERSASTSPRCGANGASTKAVDQTPVRARGKVNQKVLPYPGLLSRPISPPCASTISREIDRPSPAPPDALPGTRKNFSNTRFWYSGGMPSPLSVTSKRVDPPERPTRMLTRSEEHTSELQSPCNLVCRLLLEKKKKK